MFCPQCTHTLRQDHSRYKVYACDQCGIDWSIEEVAKLPSVRNGKGGNRQGCR